MNVCHTDSSGNNNDNDNDSNASNEENLSEESESEAEDNDDSDDSDYVLTSGRSRSKNKSKRKNKSKSKTKYTRKSKSKTKSNSKSKSKSKSKSTTNSQSAHKSSFKSHFLPKPVMNEIYTHDCRNNGKAIGYTYAEIIEMDPEAQISDIGHVTGTSDGDRYQGKRAEWINDPYKVENSYNPLNFTWLRRMPKQITQGTKRKQKGKPPSPVSHKKAKQTTDNTGNTNTNTKNENGYKTNVSKTGELVFKFIINPQDTTDFWAMSLPNKYLSMRFLVQGIRMRFKTSVYANETSKYATFFSKSRVQTLHGGDLTFDVNCKTRTQTKYPDKYPWTASNDFKKYNTTVAYQGRVFEAVCNLELQYWARNGDVAIKNWFGFVKKVGLRGLPYFYAYVAYHIKQHNKGNERPDEDGIHLVAIFLHNFYKYCLVQYCLRSGFLSDFDKDDEFKDKRFFYHFGIKDKMASLAGGIVANSEHDEVSVYDLGKHFGYQKFSANIFFTICKCLFRARIKVEWSVFCQCL